MFQYKFKWNLLLVAVLATGVLMTGCKKDDPGTEQENITKIVVKLTGVTNPAFQAEFAWKDSDGDGGNAPTIEQIVLPANAVYQAEMEVYDETKNPVAKVSDEIKAENKVHLFRYTTGSGALVVSNPNTDDDGQPFGQVSTWTAGAVSTGSVQIRLYHEPTDKNATDPGGEVDFEVTFPVRVQ